MTEPSAVYRPRDPKASAYYRCIEDYFEEFVRVYDERFSKKFGFWRPHIEKVIYRYLDCGDLHNGFARVKCGDCGHEIFVPYSCYPQRETMKSSPLRTAISQDPPNDALRIISGQQTKR